ncbi:response regulator transcription factor [Alkalihalobacillus sp. 1P02AB]|uniref:response regulator transcription factor n=1 Tax=Alkalihalobacillus sp. 1P02AB TaxID=3132260 RepID=UPI0039A440BC
MNSTILILEDDIDIQNFLMTALQANGFDTIASSTGFSALELFKSEQPNLVLLDVQLPDLNGFEVCRKIRELSNVPIIFVSCLDDGFDVIHGLELGGDDYITKPFDLYELTARIKANLRRTPIINERLTHNPLSIQMPEKLKTNKITFNFHTQMVLVNGENIYLSNKEFQILSILAQYPNKTFSAQELYTMIWGVESLGETRTLKVHISNLRKKLESSTGHSTIIKTVKGFGYQLCTDKL